MKPGAKITILVLGSEIVSGRTLDTNSQFISQLLVRYGFAIERIVAIRDVDDDICATIAQEFERVNVIIATGGLGPTFDDVTTAAVARYFDLPLTFNAEAYASIKRYFRDRKAVLTPARRKQAILPRGCKIFKNEEGVAPGMAVHKDEKYLLAVPGVPREMRVMCERHIAPFLSRTFSAKVIREACINTAGISESDLERKFKSEVHKSSGASVEYGIYPRCGEVHVKVTVSGKTKMAVERRIKRHIRKIEKLIGPYIYGYNDDSLPGVVVQRLRELKKTVAIAESCTGGLISKTVTDIPGASKVFKGGCIAYSNQAKQDLLRVPTAILRRHGAVSPQVARCMAKNVCKVFNADCGIAVTGIAGPTGGTKDKPVGLVYVGLRIDGKTTVIKFVFPGSREAVRIKTMKHALFNVIRLVNPKKRLNCNRSVI